MQLVGQVRGEELGVHLFAAFDHEPADTACPEVVEQRPEINRVTLAGDDG